MKKIISFSLYNNIPAFQVGAVVNVLEAKRLYPDWKCRFYTTDDDAICKQLEYLGAEIVRMDDHWMNQGHHYGSLWRFLAVDDGEVCIFRDTDSVVNERELGAVNEWLATDKQWHIMHDHKHHKSSKIMAGMFGYRICEQDAHGGRHIFDFKNKDSMLELIKGWLGGSIDISKSFDQRFLDNVIYPKTNNNALSHGIYGQPFPEHTPCRYGNFVGDYSFWAGGWKGFVNGDERVKNSYFEKNAILKGACIHHNLGLGDHILMNGAVRYILKKQKLEQIRVVCKRNNYKNVFHMYRDDPRIEVITINRQPNMKQECKAAGWINWYTSHRSGTSIEFPLLGNVYCGANFEKMLYKMVGAPPEERFNGFYFERDKKREERLLEKLNLPEKYILTCLNNSNKLDIKTEPPVVEFQNLKDDLIFDWIPVIQNATEIHSINTSFFHLVNAVNPDCDKIYYSGRLPEVDHGGWRRAN